MPPRKRREAIAERLEKLLTTTFEKYKAITGAGKLRDFAKEAEEEDEDKVNPTFAEVHAFLNDKERSQVCKEENLNGKVVFASPFKKESRWPLTT
jgi:hypothetical protein